MFHHARKCYPSWMRWLVFLEKLLSQFISRFMPFSTLNFLGEILKSAPSLKWEVVSPNSR